MNPSPEPESAEKIGEANKEIVQAHDELYLFLRVVVIAS